MRLTNVVVQGDLGCSVDLRHLTETLANVRYEPRSFSAMIWQHRKIKGNCMLFSTGQINCNRKCSSFLEGRQRLRRYARIVQKLGYAVKLRHVRVITASASHLLSGRIDPHRLPLHFSYEPELFPAVMFRRKGLHYICHLSGKILITGIKHHRDLDAIYPVILELECIRGGEWG